MLSPFKTLYLSHYLFFQILQDMVWFDLGPTVLAARMKTGEGWLSLPSHAWHLLLQVFRLYVDVTFVQHILSIQIQKAVSKAVSAACRWSRWWEKAQCGPLAVISVRMGHCELKGDTDYILQCVRWMVGEVSKNTWLLSALMHSPRAVTVHQGDSTVCVWDRESMPTPHLDFSHWAYGHLDSLRGSRDQVKSGLKDGVREG